MKFRPGPLNDNIPLFGMMFSYLDLRNTLDYLDSEVLGIPGNGVFIFTANVDHTVRFNWDHEFRHAYTVATMVFPDGMPLIWASWLLGRPLRERVTGIDLLLGLCHLADRKRYPCFFLGAEEDTLALAVSRLRQQFPNLPIAGYHHGFFDNDREVLALIQEARPSILFVGMGSPKQEQWISAHQQHFNCRIVLAVGGSFEVVGGRKPRAALWIQIVGLEWLWRLLLEPRRLWKRYLVADLRFIFLLAFELWSLRVRPHLSEGL